MNLVSEYEKQRRHVHLDGRKYCLYNMSDRSMSHWNKNNESGHGLSFHLTLMVICVGAFKYCQKAQCRTFIHKIDTTFVVKDVHTNCNSLDYVTV